jgi:acyl-CoA synthetase (NDP forming)
LILFGLGGIYTELFKDSVVRIQPLSDTDAEEMVRAVKAYKLLEGFRGAPPADTPAIEELLLRLSALAEDFPRIKELDLNPVRAFAAGEGYAVVDARVLLS